MISDSSYTRVHRAGPRKQIYFEPEEVKAGIVTCGGLCPGLNDVIRQVSDLAVVDNYLFVGQSNNTVLGS